MASSPQVPLAGLALARDERPHEITARDDADEPTSIDDRDALQHPFLEDVRTHRASCPHRLDHLLS